MKKEVYEKAVEIQRSIRQCTELRSEINNHFNLNLGGVNDGYITLHINSKFLTFGVEKIDNNLRARNILDGKTQDDIYKLITSGLDIKIENLQKEFDDL